MKNLFYSLASAAIFVLAAGCENKSCFYDEAAIAELDQLSAAIGELNSLSVLVTAENQGNRTISDVYIKGNNKLHVISRSEKGRKAFFYNGQEFAVYQFATGKYDQVAAPPTTIETIDSINRTFGVHFPAADFFYPTFVDDLMAHFDTIYKLEDAEIEGKMYTQIQAKSKEISAYITVDKNTHAPYALEVFKNDNSAQPTYASTFTMWQFNPDLADDIFTFSPPENAIETNLLSAQK